MPILLSVLQLTVLVAVGDHTFEEMSRGKCGWYVSTYIVIHGRQEGEGEYVISIR